MLISGSDKKTSRYLLPLAIFSIAAGFLFFGNATRVLAEQCVCTGQVGSKDAQTCLNDKAYTTDECSTKCTQLNYIQFGLYDASTPCKAAGGITDQSPIGALKEVDPMNDVSEAIKWLLEVILSFVGILLSVAATIFGWIINVDNFKKVVDSTVIYEIWKDVRDLMNIAFILVLLYSAFCTILQIEKYNYKKILLMLVIMALLVNFSFPITRFIIDTSNVLMYTITNTLLGNSAGNALGSITDNSGIKAILKPNSATATYLIAAIIFTFILAITLLAVGILLIIRMIALALLIIFSPVAFVASIISVGGSYSSKWWDNLFRYSFFGPIMIFIIFIATKLMGSMALNTADFQKMANTNTLDPSMIGSIAYFAIPIVLLWMGMGVAQSMSIAGAGAVMGGAQKFIGKAGKFAAKAPFKAAWWGMKKTGYPGGIKQKWDSVTSKFASGQAEREARIAGRGLFAVAGAGVKNAESRAAEYEKNHESDASLIIKTEAGDAGAALALVKRGKMDDKIYGNFIANSKDASLKEHVTKKLKQNRVDILINYRVDDQKDLAKVKKDNNLNDAEAREFIAKEEIGKLNPEKWAEQYWKDILKKPTIEVQKAIKEKYNAMDPLAQEEIKKKLGPDSAAALKKGVMNGSNNKTKGPVGFNR